MRIIAAALAIAATVSGPASAQESCPLSRAVYSSAEAPTFAMTFRADSDSETGTVAAIAERGRILSRHLVDLRFTHSLGYSVAYTVGSSPMIEASPGEEPLGGRIVALTRDFRDVGIGAAGTAAPYAIVIPDIGSQLYNATKHDPDRQTSIPEGAWILSGCR
ncbi:hypothetical protein [Parvibaculum sp.]|uniref:hypothetical protein n=1 Tax=Parvibaculum sp. TaxID=2024848 RepID=UPI001DB0616C|nr:hypothetical protein [Parvibaculum sp.]MBX3487847.1 hypothetical protein [Parvibaculum sp.]